MVVGCRTIASDEHAVHLVKCACMHKLFPFAAHSLISVCRAVHLQCIQSSSPPPPPHYYSKGGLSAAGCCSISCEDVWRCLDDPEWNKHRIVSSDNMSVYMCTMNVHVHTHMYMYAVHV